MSYNNNNIMCIIIVHIIGADNIRIRDNPHGKIYPNIILLL